MSEMIGAVTPEFMCTSVSGVTRDCHWREVDVGGMRQQRGVFKARYTGWNVTPSRNASEERMVSSTPKSQVYGRTLQLRRACTVCLIHALRSTAVGLAVPEVDSKFQKVS